MNNTDSFSIISPPSALTRDVDQPTIFPGFSNFSLPSTDLETDGSESTSSISLIKEERHDNIRLRNQVFKLEEHNRILTNRLSNLGEPVRTAVGENELLIPDTSKELFDNVVRENITLKRELQRGKEMDSPKDLMIAKVQAELETSKLQTKELAEQCRQLVFKQEEMKSRSITDNIGRLSLDNKNEDYAHLKREVGQLRTEKDNLRKQLEEVVKCNSNWRDYDKQREDHVEKLSRELADSQRVNEHVLKNAMALENQNKQLKHALTQLTESRKAAGGMTQEESDRMHALERQVHEFTTAYQQGQKDREKAMQKVADLEDTNSILKKQLEQFQTTQMTYLAERRAEAMRRHRMEYEQQCMQNQFGMPQQRGIISHGTSNFAVVADGDDDDDDCEDEDVIDMPMSHSLSNTSSSGPSAQNSLDCPKCKQQFPVSDPMRFLEHTDTCEG